MELIDSHIVHQAAAWLPETLARNDVREGIVPAVDRAYLEVVTAERSTASASNIDRHSGVDALNVNS